MWRVPAYLPYLQPKLTPEMVAEAEAKIGFKLPESYLELLRVQNGGYIRFQLPQMVHREIAGIGPYFPSSIDFDWDEVQEYVSYNLKGLVPFDGDGHWHMCLDYRGNLNPQVTLVDIECDRESPIANSFTEYLDLLELDVDSDALAIREVADIEDLIQQLSEALSISFEEPDSWAHGYPVYRAACSELDSPEWLWISPNLVPRGFVRPDDDRYDELKSLLPGKAKRYNDLADTSYILSSTDGVKDRLVDALERLGIEYVTMDNIAD